MTVTVEIYQNIGNLCDTDLQDQVSYINMDGVLLKFTDDQSAFEDASTIQTYGGDILDGIVSDRNDANGWNNYARANVKARHASDNDVIFRVSTSELLVNISCGVDGAPNYDATSTPLSPNYEIGGTETLSITLPAEIFTDVTEQATDDITIIQRDISLDYFTSTSGNPDETDMTGGLIWFRVHDTGHKIEEDDVWEDNQDDLINLVTADHAEANNWTGYAQDQALASLVAVFSSSATTVGFAQYGYFFLGEAYDSGQYADYDIEYDDVLSMGEIPGTFFNDGIARTPTGTWTIYPEGGSNPFPSEAPQAQYRIRRSARRGWPGRRGKR